MNKSVIAAVLTVLLVGVAATGCSSQKKMISSAEESSLLKESVESGEYKIYVDRMYPASGKSRPVSYGYYVEVRNDSVFSYLPYYGQAYSAPYGGGEGLIFESAVRNYRLEYGSKGEANISFDTRTSEDAYRFSISVFPGGSSSINVNPNNKQSINFSGKLE